MFNTKWIFGNNAGLDFSTATNGNKPTAISGSRMRTNEGCASIADAQGNLLFYTNGQHIWDGQHNLKHNNVLNGHHSSTQSGILFPDPADSNPSNPTKFYVFSADGLSGTPDRNTNLINTIKPISAIQMDTATPSWSYTVPAVFQSLKAGDKAKGYIPTEKITAIRHANGQDYWVIGALQRNGDWNGAGTLRVFLVTATGVTHHSDIDLKDSRGTDRNIDNVGYMKANIDGTMLALANHHLRSVTVYSFDKQAGTISNEIVITDNANTYGVEFSPNSSYLYYTTLATYTTANIQRYEFSTGQITTIATYTATTTYNASSPATIWDFSLAALQIGPDNVIYAVKPFESTLAAIINPDDATPTFDLNYVELAKDTQGIMGLPNIITSFNRPDEPTDSHDDCDCGCNGCNENADEQDKELMERAKVKTNIVPANPKGHDSPFTPMSCATIIRENATLAPVFYLHWGDSKRDVIENHDNEIFYITACNPFSDVEFKGFRITSVSFDPAPGKPYQARIVPDRFISFDCLHPCSCKTREFSLTTRDEENQFVGDKNIVIEYCIDEIVILSDNATSGKASFPVEIIKDEE
ncbi:MAG: hypothetical protein IM638_19265 [Bacteroidetes bacterium]|nr:hypothetical protein [Bacteroidota bacterium]